jgi:hypothetical protein
MTSMTTALVMISSKGFGPFASPGWRVNATVQVVDGGSNGPFLLTSQCDPDSERDLGTLFVNSLEGEFLVDALVMLLGAQVGSESALGWLVETENAALSHERIEFAPYWDLDARVRDNLLGDFKDRVKLGVVTLDDSGSLNQQVLAEMKGLGVEMHSFQAADKFC